MKKYIKQYEEEGVVVIPDVFTRDEMKKLKKAAYALDVQKIKEAGYPHSPSEQAYNKLSLIFFPALADEYINSIRIDKRLVDIVKAFLGNNVRQINNQIYFREKGDIDQFAWHQDLIFREPSNFTNVEEGYLQTIIAVDDINTNNGAIQFVPGSHKGQTIPRPGDLRYFDPTLYEGKKYTAKAGSVLLWNVKTIHGSEKNESKRDRMTYMNGFCKADNTSSYPDYLLKGKVQKAINPILIP